jgi:hypothetical protein
MGFRHNFERFVYLFVYILATDCFHIMFVYNSKQADFVFTLLFKIPMHWMIFHPGNPLKQEEYVFFQVRGRSQTTALSFYRSQNVLCRFKVFEPAQKFDCI